jgi:hypothetical protein
MIDWEIMDIIVSPGCETYDFSSLYPEIFFEFWRPVNCLDSKGLLYVSNYGNIKNCRNRIISTNNKNGRLYIRYTNKTTNKTTTAPVDRVVAVTFLGPDRSQVVHIDGNITNNMVENLKYG